MLFVVAAALVDPDGRVLLAQRPEGKQMAGLWEFPGGKVDKDETPPVALVRELKEELGITTSTGCLRPVTFVTHPLGESGAPEEEMPEGGCNPLFPLRAEDPSQTMLLMLYLCRRWVGTPAPLEGQAMQWLHPRDMMKLPMPPADRPLVLALMDVI